MKLANGSVLRFGEILLRHHSLIGRGTCVIRASVINPPAGRNPVVAVKITSSASSRRSETEILENARRKAIDVDEQHENACLPLCFRTYLLHPMGYV